MGREERLRLVSKIMWKSVDKDNMEFEARISCFQKDALDEMIAEEKRREK